MQTLKTTELSEKLVAQYLAYSFLGKAFFEDPTVELFNTLKEEALFADWPLEGSNNTMQAGLDILQPYCDQWDEAAIQEVKGDYARLFIGPNHLLAPPWESVYRSEERLLFEKETLQVRAMYRQYGLALPSDCLQPDDHFGLEMFFVAHLCRLGLNAIENEEKSILENVQQTLADFFEEHICQWADLFLADVKTNAITPYYQGLAVLTSGCIAHTKASWHIFDETVST